MHEWNEVRGVWSRELYAHAGNLYWSDDDSRITGELASLLWLADKWGEVAIHFSSSGYHDPGSMYGGPDYLGSPPEGEDRRTMVRVELCRGVREEAETFVLPKGHAEAIFDELYDEVMEVELEMPTEEDLRDCQEWPPQGDAWEGGFADNH